MNSYDKSSEITVQILLSLRSEDDAVHLITEKLRVREMGPADHIRTKHEVKTFVESGDTTIAESLLKRAEQRRELKQTIAPEITNCNRQDL
jgi:hypothetical protein